jgi:hypothetical protein
MSYNPFDFQIAFLDVKKDWDVDIKFDYEADYDLDVKIDKDIKVDVDIKTDVDLDDNLAVLTGTVENISSHGVVQTSATFFTDDVTSLVQMDTVAIVGSSANAFEVQGIAQGHNTYAELDFNIQVYDFGSTITIVGESATD